MIVLSFLGDAMAWMNWGTSGWTWPIILMAAAGLLWASRFVRDEVLVYVGLWHAVAAVADLTLWLVPWNGTGIPVGWLAISLALLSLVLWLAGAIGRRRRLEPMYWAPCLNTSLLLTLGVFILATSARLLTRQSFLLGTAALVADSVILVLIGRTRQWAGLIYPAVASFTAASYVVLLSVGKQDPAMAYVLGLNAVVQGLAIWVLGDFCRRLASPWPQLCARPLFHSVLGLTVLAIAPAFDSPLTMSLVALSFLLTVKSLPSEALDLSGRGGTRRSRLFSLAGSSVANRAHDGEYRRGLPGLADRICSSAEQGQAFRPAWPGVARLRHAPL